MQQSSFEKKENPLYIYHKREFQLIQIKITRSQKKTTLGYNEHEFPLQYCVRHPSFKRLVWAFYGLCFVFKSTRHLWEQEHSPSVMLLLRT